MPQAGEPDNELGEFPPCPAGPSSSPAGGEALGFFRRIDLPVPRPTIAPGRAIVGLRAYLEANSEVARTYTSDTPFGRLSLTATSTVWVDWGEGDGWHGPHDDAGGPYPDGGITHVYGYSGTYDVRVRQRWTATWSLGTETGTIDTGLVTEGRIDEFEVEEREAVVR